MKRGRLLTAAGFLDEDFAGVEGDGFDGAVLEVEDVGGDEHEEEDGGNHDVVVEAAARRRSRRGRFSGGWALGLSPSDFERAASRGRTGG